MRFETLQKPLAALLSFSLAFGMAPTVALSEPQTPAEEAQTQGASTADVSVAKAQDEAGPAQGDAASQGEPTQDGSYTLTPQGEDDDLAALDEAASEDGAATNGEATPEDATSLQAMAEELYYPANNAEGEPVYDASGARYTYAVTRTEGTTPKEVRIVRVDGDPSKAEGSVDLVIPEKIDGAIVSELGTDTSGITGSNTNRFRSLTIPGGVTKLCQNVRLLSGDNIAKVTFADDSQVTVIPDQCFGLLYGLQEVVLPPKLQTIGANAFLGSALTSISFPSTLTSIGNNAFNSCEQLTTVTIPEGVTSLGEGAFDYCTSLKSVTLPNSLQTIGKAAFSFCTSLTEAKLGTSMKDSQLRTIGDAAFSGTSLASIDIPDSVTSIGVSAFDWKGVSVDDTGAKIEDERDGDVGTLATVNLGSSQEASKLETIGTNAFRDAVIKRIALPNQLSSYGYDSSRASLSSSRAETAFTGCYSLETIVWPSEYAPGKSFTNVGGFQDFNNLKDDVVSSLPWWITTIDPYAFQSCGFVDLVIPHTVTSIGESAFYEQWDASNKHTLSSITFVEEEGDENLRIEDYAFGMNSSPEGAKLRNTTIKLPRRVSYLGDSVFDGGVTESNTYYVYNKDITFKCFEDDEASDPWYGAEGGICYYPEDAAEGSHILRLKAQYAEYEQSDLFPDKMMQFNPFDAGQETVTHTIRGSVPAGATVRLESDYLLQEFTGPSFETTVEDGKKVVARVYLEGYADYAISPAGTGAAAPLTQDWGFDVTTADLTPLSDTGTIRVLATGDYAEGANVALVDWRDGTIVRQGTVGQLPAYNAEQLPPGTYTAIAYAKNDFFSRIATAADFEMMGYGPSDYAQGTVELPVKGDVEIELAVPQLDTSRLSALVSSGELLVPTSLTVPGNTVFVRAKYAMAEGREADSFKISVPAGLEPVSVTSGAKNYGAGSFDVTNLTLTVDGLAGADRTAGALTIALKAVSGGSYGLSASVVTGGVTVPVGSGALQVTSLQLDVPEGALDSTEFAVTVYAAPETAVGFQIDGQDTGVSCTTNKVGRGTATLTIPEELVSFMDPFYEVTATSGAESVTEQVTYFYDEIVSPKVQSFSFVHAKETVILAQDGKDNSGGSYTVMANPSVHPDLYSPTWPFTATVDSAIALEDSMVLQLGMMDNSMRNETMTLQKTEDLGDGTTRYTYAANVAIGTGNIDDRLTSHDIPVRFDVVPQVAEEDATGTSRASQELLNSMKREYFALRTTTVEPDLPDFIREWLDANKDQINPELFNEAWRHENWDKSSERYQVWNILPADLKDDLQTIEDHVGEIYDSLAVLTGTNKAITKYGSLQEFLNDNYGYQNGQAADAVTLQSEGFTILHDNDRESVPGAVTPVMQGGSLAAEDAWTVPEWTAIRYPEVDAEGLVAQDEGNKTLEIRDSNGNVSKLQIPESMMQNGKIPGVSTEDIVSNGLASVEKEMERFQKEAIEKAHWDQYGGAVDNHATAAASLCPFEPVAVAATAKSFFDLNNKAKNFFDRNEWEERLGEAERIKNMIDYYQKRAPGSVCQRALIQEQKFMMEYLKDLWMLSPLKQRMFEDMAWSTILTGVGGYATAAGDDLTGTVAAGASAAEGYASAALQSDLLAKMYFDRAMLQKYRAYREAVCRHDDFGKLHYKKPAKVDPSGFTYAGVESERVEGVTSTIYQLVDGAWVPWDEAAEWDEVNPQLTTAGGLFAWDVPQGQWKALFQKEGYEDTWSAEMPVPPEWTNVGINLLRSDPPVGISHVVADGFGHADVTFDQWVKAATLPIVTVNGTPVGSLGWLDVQAGHDETGAETELARTIRIPLADFAKKGAKLEVAVNGAVGYTSKTQVEPYVFTIEIPDDGVIVPDTPTPGPVNPTPGPGGTTPTPGGTTPTSPAPASSGAKSNPSVTTPHTADTGAPYAAMALVATVGAGLVALGRRRRKE